jgi:hypothetical protein
MYLETFCFTAPDGWSVDPLPTLDSDRTLLVAFGSSAFLDNPEPLRALARTYPHSHLVGCSTAGEIRGATLLPDDSLAVAAVRFDAARVAVAAAPVSSREESLAAGIAIARQLDGPDLRAVLVFSDGLQVNGSELVRGLNTVLGPEVVITGGLAGDGSRFERTWVMVDGAPRGGFVTAAGLYGSTLRIGCGSKGGWDAFGLERVVTRSVGNVLLELDHQPALTLYKEYLGDLAAGLPATGLLFPLAIRTETAETSLVRTILAVDEQEQSLTFAGDVPQGASAQLMRANFERLIDGAADAAAMISGVPEDGSPALAIAVSCVGRRLVLGTRVEDEIEATLDVLPPATRQVGFYSYGELSPSGAGSCDLHNQTMTLTLVGEVVPA